MIATPIMCHQAEKVLSLASRLTLSRFSADVERDENGEDDEHRSGVVSKPGMNRANNAEKMLAAPYSMAAVTAI